MSRTELQSLGEFKLINHLTEKFTNDQNVIKGIGDDAAIVSPCLNTVITTDLLIEHIHFDLAYMPLKHLGYKAVAVNISDLCAMNAQPKHITVSIAVSNRFSVEALEELYEGIRLACLQYKVNLIGGDTSASNKGLIISVTAIGEATQEKVVYRNGAKPNDLLCVSGDLGAAYLGLQILEREKQVFLKDPNMKPQLVGKEYILKRFMQPQARVDVIEQLNDKNLIPSSMIDISDGLSSEIKHLSTQSNVGFLVYEDRLPIHDDTRQQAFEFGIDPTLCAMSGGEDYELLFTLDPSLYNELMFIADIHVIGYAHAAEKGNILQTKQGNHHTITALGWDGFAANPST